MVSMNLVIKDDVDNVDSDIYLMTHTTNPLLTKDTIKKAIKLFKSSLENKEADSLFTVNKIHERFYDKNAKAINHDPKDLVRTQDLEPWIIENSNLYLFTKKSYYSNDARIGDKPIMLETSSIESVDIDTEDDWLMGEVIVNSYIERGLV